MPKGIVKKKISEIWGYIRYAIGRVFLYFIITDRPEGLKGNKPSRDPKDGFNCFGK